MGAVVAWREWITKYTNGLSLVHSGSGSASVSSSLPLANLGDRRLAKVCRINTVGASVGGGLYDHGTNTVRWITDGLLDKGRAVIIGLLNHNIPQYASSSTPLRIRCYSDTGGTTLIYDSGNISSTLFKQITSAPYGGLFYNHTFCIPPSRLATPVARVEVAVAYGNTPFSTTTLDIGRLFLADGIVVPEGIQGTWRTRIIDPSVVRRSRGQQVYADDLLPYRSLDFGVDITTDQQGFDLDCVNRTDVDGTADAPAWAACKMECGVRGEVLIVPDTALSTYYAKYSAIYGTFANNLEIEHAYGANHRVTGTVLEAR